ncbi:MAG TPA: PAS domain-containing protein, partial [Candidatus Polarisedimenticolaceae bacterium]|nr:PAS domain-containing protein [Candidatus Polarisedimenticolaceae bacterium]
MRGLIQERLERFLREHGELPAGVDDLLRAADDTCRELEARLSQLSDADPGTRAVLQAIPDLFFRLDRDGRILDCKGGSLAEAGRARSQLLGGSIHELPVAGGPASPLSQAVRR